MGPIEQALRGVRWPSLTWSVEVSDDALDFAIRQAGAMGADIRHEFLSGRTADAEVLSEAIEAAEALGL